MFVQLTIVCTTWYTYIYTRICLRINGQYMVT